MEKFTEKFDIVIRNQRDMAQTLKILNQKADRMQETLEAVAREEHTYPTLFIIEPADKDKWSTIDYLTFPLDLCSRKLRIVFICAKSLKPVEYDSKRGLEFRIPTESPKAALKFFEKYGLAIRMASLLLATAADKILGVGVDVGPALQAANDAASAALTKADFVHYYETIGPLVNSGAGHDVMKNPERGELQREAITSYGDFRAFLNTIGFDAKKLPMKQITEDEGKWIWVAKKPAGDLAQTATADSDEAEQSGDNNAKSAPSKAAQVNRKERAPSDGSSNDLPQEAAIDESVATVSHGGSEEAKNSGDINADSTSSGTATDSKGATPQSQPQCPTCCLLC